MNIRDMSNNELAAAVARELLGWHTPPEYSVTRWVAGGVVQDAPRVDWTLAVAVLEECRRRGWAVHIGIKPSLCEAAVWSSGLGGRIIEIDAPDPARAICEVALAAVRGQRGEG